MNSCGVTEEELQEQRQFAEQVAKRDLNRCKRCSERKPSILLQKKDAFCCICFVDYASHKFRSTIGKSKQLKPTHRVLLAVSSGQNSQAMLDLTRDSLHSPISNNRLFFQPYLLHIDESVLGLHDSDHVPIITTIPLLKSYKMPLYISSLEAFCFEPLMPTHIQADQDSEIVVPTNSEARQKFQSLLSQFTSLTSKEEFLRQVRRNLIMDVARKENMQHVFLASNATRLSIQLLTDVAQGKGSQINSEICFLDERDDLVKVLKPMRELTSKEIAFWNRFRNVSFVELRDLGTGLPNKASIGKMTEAFIQKLQRDFPATTYTIGKIGGKLTSIKNAETKCSFCQCQIETSEATGITAKESLILSNRFAAKSSVMSFDGAFCYGCNILLREHRHLGDLQPILIRPKRFDQSDFDQYLL